MGYLRCHACGAKALSAASTCPRCSNSLDVFDAAGRRVALRRCAGCGLMHRADRSCETCGEVPAVSARTWSLRGAAAAGVAATLWIGASLGGGTQGGRAPATTVGVTAPAADLVAVASGVTSPSLAGEPEPVVQTRDPATPSASTGPADPADAVDPTTWQPAVARTWVNVRSDASLDGQVVGVISPDARAMLGTTRGGWRRVTLDNVSGWVDPRLFSALSEGS